MEYTVIISNQFKKDFRRCIKRGLDMKLITDAMDLLKATGKLPDQYRPHPLKGDRKGQWECHIQPNWLFSAGTAAAQPRRNPFVNRHSHTCQR